MDEQRILEIAKNVLRIEIEGIENVCSKLNSNFAKAVELLFKCRGRVVITGMGKSGIVGKKIASTLASTGTPAFFLHPAEGVHGDLGMISKDDLVIAISNSGETDEVMKILPIIRRMGNKLIAITGNPSSTLGKAADVVIDAGVKEEACPMGLAPTASTTAALALGDALAIALLEMRGFKEEDFALIHPAGAIGKRLLLRVEDIMHGPDRLPLVRIETIMKEAIFEITSKGFGITGVVDDEGNLVGCITDGDLRRALEKSDDLWYRKASEVMTKNPKGIEKDALVTKALNRMEYFKITALFVFEKEGDKKPIGILHLHDILRSGVV